MESKKTFSDRVPTSSHACAHLLFLLLFLFYAIRCLLPDTKLPGLCGLGAGDTLFDGKCLSLTDEEIAQWPGLSFGLDNGVVLEMKAQDLLLRGDVRAVK